MCGIAGILNLDGAPVSADVLRSMTGLLSHRGPDGAGEYLDRSVGLGHRRLAIIDLSPAAAQPMATEDGKLVISYNGEIYNFRELRRELEGLGHRFRSKSDTEVLLSSFRQWGPDCLGRFNGMFAFAIWDRERSRLFLARDRYGIKPLYTVQLGPVFLFASEIKAFLKHPAFKVEVSLPHVLEYFSFQNLFSDGTLFKGVKLLPAGHWLDVGGDGQARRLQRYWDFEFREPERERPDEEYAEELHGLLRQAVKRQLVSDVPVGSYLSGGLDSGSIVAIASSEVPDLNTFTCGFDMTSVSGLELGVDERQKAEALSYLFKTQQYEVVLKAGDLQRCISRLVWHLEDPRVGQSYPNYYVSRLASKFVKVVLSGAGGDELFAGYPWRYSRDPSPSSFSQFAERYYNTWHRLIPTNEIPNLFTPEVWNEIGNLRMLDTFRSVFRGQEAGPATIQECIQQSLYFESKTFLHGLLLVEDKLSMAHGLETRVPFLDNDLVDFALSVPLRLKLRNLSPGMDINENIQGSKPEIYFQRTKDGKLLLRQVAGAFVPPAVSQQHKQGFSSPDASWFRGESIDYVRSILHDPHSRIYRFFREDTVRRLVETHFVGSENRRLFIWSLLVFEWWLRIFESGDEASWARLAASGQQRGRGAAVE